MIVLKLIERIKNNKAIKKALLIISPFIAFFIIFLFMGVNGYWFPFQNKALEILWNALIYMIRYCGIGLILALTAIPIISIINNVKAKKSKWITVSSACIFVVELVEFCVFLFLQNKSWFLSRPFACFAELFDFFPLLPNIATFIAALLAMIFLFSRGRKINYALPAISLVAVGAVCFACFLCVLGSSGV